VVCIYLYTVFGVGDQGINAACGTRLQLSEYTFELVYHCTDGTAAAGWVYAGGESTIRLHPFQTGWHYKGENQGITSNSGGGGVLSLPSHPHTVLVFSMKRSLLSATSVLFVKRLTLDASFGNGSFTRQHLEKRLQCLPLFIDSFRIFEGYQFPPSCMMPVVRMTRATAVCMKNHQRIFTMSGNFS
jgi:hypothetical protein